MKKALILFASLLFLTSCAQDPAETSSTETSLPAETSNPVHFNETFVNRYCYDAIENSSVYCGYVKDGDNLTDYDISWLNKKTMLNGNETYYEDLEMEKFLNDDEVILPVNRKFCENIKSESIQMYAGLWCECHKLNDEAFYIDINEAFNHFNKDTELRFSTSSHYNDTLSGISFGDTKIYELIESGEKFKPYPSSYMYFPANAEYLREKYTDELQIEHYYLIADLSLDGFDYSLIIEFAETEKGYFVTIMPNKTDILNLPSEIADSVHVVAHGYILK